MNLLNNENGGLVRIIDGSPLYLKKSIPKSISHHCTLHSGKSRGISSKYAFCPDAGSRIISDGRTNGAIKSKCILTRDLGV
jgi:hypothetical protein